MTTQKDPKRVVGRDKLIAEVWNKLRRPSSQGSLQFLAERRVGKTTVMTKMAAEPAAGFDVLFLEVEGIDSPERFVELLLNRVRPMLNRTGKLQAWFNDLLSNFQGTEIGGIIKLPGRKTIQWQSVLDRIIEQLCADRSGRTVLLIFDELPYMLQKIGEASTEAGRNFEALTLLDNLRALRQRHSNLRMIFAGSIGLHHVLRELKNTQLNAAPLNDMEPVEITPLNTQDAIELAKQLLADAAIQTVDSLEEAAQTLAAATGQVPFYMERLTSCLATRDQPVNLSDIERTVWEQLTSDHDPWEMEHFRTRLDVYYRNPIEDTNGKTLSESQIARSILDHCSLCESAQSINQIWDVIRSQHHLSDRSLVIQLLASLSQDHYLASDLHKNYRFRFPLIQQWWRIAQGLHS